MIRGVVREWHEGLGWGVVDSAETPGGCWVHFSHVVADGYRALAPGTQVDLAWETPGQDGYPFRAVALYVVGTGFTSR